MHPVLFGPIKTYGLLLAISFALGIWVAARRGRTAGLKPEFVYDLSFVILVSSLVGVRLFYVATHLGEFQGQWHRIFLINQGGLTLYGGIIGALLAGWWWCRRRGVGFLQAADIMIPSVALGIGITRIGCFMAGCCYGEPCSVPWGVHFPAGSPPVMQFGPVAVHPSQLYASAGGLAIFGALLLLERWRAWPGDTLGRFLLLYGIQRFVIDFTRYYEPSQVMLFGWSNNQWISVGLMLVGIVLMLRARPAPTA